MDGGYNGKEGGKPPFKRYKRDETADPTNPNPSIVVHVRNMNPKATEADLLEALSHFGPVAYATCMPSKRMALVEFEDLEAARKCVVFAQSTPINVAGTPALFNYSTSQQIQRIGLESEIPSRVLVLTIYNAHYAINVEVIHQICSPHGEVLRIAMIKRTMVQALVEFESVEAAKKTKHAINGADIYSGCCTLKVEFAKPDHVKVTRNDQEQWDYTVKDQTPTRKALIPDEPKPMITPGMSGSRPPPVNGGSGSGYMAYADDYGPPPASRPAYPSAYPQVDSYSRGGRSTSSYDRADYGGISFSRDAHYAPQRPAPARGYDSGEYGRPFRGASSVVMVYGVNHEAFNCDKIFNLLCCYGNCLKVKFMLKKQDTCMAEMGNPQGVTEVMNHLQNTKVFGTTLTFRPSKQSNLHDMPDQGTGFQMPDGTASYVDYTRSRNQRFNTPEAASRNRLGPPSEQLHWCNVPPHMTEERLKKIFADKGTKVPQTVIVFNTKSDRSSAGLAVFDSPEAATEALMIANHTPVHGDGEGRNVPPYIMKLSYGKQ